MSDNEISTKCLEQTKFYQIMEILGPAGGSDYKDWVKYLLRKQQKEAQVKKKPKQTQRQCLFIVFYSVWLLSLYIISIQWILPGFLT